MSFDTLQDIAKPLWEAAETFLTIGGGYPRTSRPYDLPLDWALAGLLCLPVVACAGMLATRRLDRRVRQAMETGRSPWHAMGWAWAGALLVCLLALHTIAINPFSMRQHVFSSFSFTASVAADQSYVLVNHPLHSYAVVLIHAAGAILVAPLWLFLAIAGGLYALVGSDSSTAITIYLSLAGITTLAACIWRPMRAMIWGIVLALAANAIFMPIVFMVLWLLGKALFAALPFIIALVWAGFMAGGRRRA